MTTDTASDIRIQRRANAAIGTSGWMASWLTGGFPRGPRSRLIASAPSRQERRVEMDAPRDARHTESAETEQIALLSQQFRPGLQRFFSKRVKEHHEVDDLVQDVFVRLVRKVNTDGAQIVAGYVFQTAQSVLNDWLRKRQVRKASVHEDLEADLPGLMDDSTPERVLVGKQSLEKATAAVLELPEVTRTIFLLRRLEGMPYRDIAKRLGMPVSTVEKHMARAVAHLDLRLNGK